MVASKFTWGLGRRKTSVARVRLQNGSGEIVINDRQLKDYFPVERLRKLFLTPLEVAAAEKRFDIKINVIGGGITGQVGACMLGISRALIKVDPTSEAPLRSHGLLTRDSRMVERKKYGMHKARRGCQFSKR